MWPANPAREGFGRALYDLRQKKRMTQQAVADLLGVKVNTEARWERGTLTPEPLTQVGAIEVLRRKRR